MIGERPRSASPAVIEAIGLRKAYGTLPVLRGVDLIVHRGEVVCIIGPSGSGKSTLLRCINLLEPVDAGHIVFCSEEVTRARRPAPIRARLGMVFQSFELFPHMTALGNVMSGPRTVRRTPRAEAEAQARALLARVGLAPKADALPAELSGGQQQRVAIARALAMRPEAILFDEPTSALDPETVGEVLAVMQSLAEEHVTMLVVTHEMSFARRAADWVMVMDAGEVIEEGPPASVFGPGAGERTRAFLRHVHAA
ncbi:MAG: amino acid ABC transporter ATP-binding protein [Acetobacteraceae bacterium]|nr:amino acid ABC transporter ATP-binding protein [Acetobacteraceae bacterium]